MRRFGGTDVVQELECSGEGLVADASLVFIVLYSASDNAIASVNVATKRCSTTASFSSCFIDEKDSRKTRLRTLIINEELDVTRRYSCNLSFVTSGSRLKTESWSLSVEGLRES